MSGAVPKDPSDPTLAPGDIVLLSNGRTMRVERVIRLLPDQSGVTCGAYAGPRPRPANDNGEADGFCLVLRPASPLKPSDPAEQ